MSTCRSEAVAVACFTNAAGIPASVFVNNVYNPDGSLYAVYYTDTAGAIVDTSVGSVAAGQCAIAQPDVEWEPLCDLLADGTIVPFFRRTVTRFDAAGAVIDPVEVADFAEDKVTAYVVAGTIGDCNTCTPEASIGVITDLSLL